MNTVAPMPHTANRSLMFATVYGVCHPCDVCCTTVLPRPTATAMPTLGSSHTASRSRAGVPATEVITLVPSNSWIAPPNVTARTYAGPTPHRPVISRVVFES